jgi:membrane protein implicated in regulation of membrane protease activity
MILLIAIILALFLPWPWTLAILIVGVILEVGEVIWGRRLARRWKAKTGPQTLIGMEAEVVSPLRPAGQVRVNGEIWAARSATGADPGDTVVVKAVDGLTLAVEAASPPDRV